MKLEIYRSVLIISVLLLTLSCGNQKTDEATTNEQTLVKKPYVKKSQKDFIENEQAEPPSFTISKTRFTEYEMKLGHAAMEDISETISAVGYVEVPDANKAEVRPYIGGYLQSTDLLIGNYVEKGQWLINLTNLEYIQLQQEYLETKEHLTYLKAVYERKKILAEENINSISSLQQAESDYKFMNAKMEGLRKKLQLIHIDPDKVQAENITASINLYAPISGYLTRVNAVMGKFADPTGDMIFEIINTSHLHLSLKVFEKDILKVKKGRKITFRIPDSDINYQGEVFLVGKNIDDDDRTVAVHCHIDESAEKYLIAGMYVEAEISYDSHKRYCLPASAFIREENRYYVYVITSEDEFGYTFKKTDVSVGQIDEECIEITGKSIKLLEGKEVLVEGTINL